MNDISRAKQSATVLADRLGVPVSIVPQYGNKTEDGPSGYFFYVHFDDGDKQFLPSDGCVGVDLGYLIRWLDCANTLVDAYVSPTVPLQSLHYDI